MSRIPVALQKRVRLGFALCALAVVVLLSRMGYLMIFRSSYYSTLAEELHEREREIKAARGRIFDSEGRILADNCTVCTVSVIHNQLEDPETVIQILSEELSMDPEKIRRLTEKYTSREIIKTNVDKETGDRIRARRLPGVKVDEDYRRYYPFQTLASHVLGFTGSDNQGIIGLEVMYDSVLKGINGRILTQTDARGMELDAVAEERVEPQPGNDLVLSLNIDLQTYAEQAAKTVMEEKQARQVSVILMNPKTGEILAMVSVPEFDCNDPFTLNTEANPETEEQKQDLLNAMWRNPCINDTYEPGSTFKIITMAAALEEGIVSLEDSFYCPGYRVVEDRRIRCHKVTGHGAETFLQGALNSCNPVFIDVGLRLGVDRYCQYFRQFGLLGKTGVDLPGEAGTIMHAQTDMGEVELATTAFGQSFQITPLHLITTAASLVNGGHLVTPHFGVRVLDAEGNLVKTFTYDTEKTIISEDSSRTLRYILKQVVSEGTGKKAAVAGYSVGGKTATSEKLPRRTGRYISSFLGFAPADDPQVIGLITIDEPVGVYYGGTIAAPVMAEIFGNILPYLNIPQEEKQQME
ncbi:penicillin-binding transpeptidase domain-containing protein [Hominifimenecus microfluidus]|uniref:Peptidoglycan glycosyltransferase n=1 Tax=Hominifimenecus microfluidus TaxID=2885348 RepID=A0AAE3E8U4_9FIRM|nr:penicillin-binding transpeptidase domain-containing protein [Hominifimenecus microfluidus]MCC2230248.1 peptidoglycan glycosyltransferase [Hominifimenecus microfluidus]